MITYLAQRRKLIAFAIGGVLLYVQTLLTPTGMWAHIVSGVILFGTGMGIWGATNELTPEQKAKVLREQARHRAGKRPTPPTPPPTVQATGGPHD